MSDALQLCGHFPLGHTHRVKGMASSDPPNHFDTSWFLDDNSLAMSNVQEQTSSNKRLTMTTFAVTASTVAGPTFIFPVAMTSSQSSLGERSGVSPCVFCIAFWLKALAKLILYIAAKAHSLEMFFGGAHHLFMFQIRKWAPHVFSKCLLALMFPHLHKK